MIGTHNPREMPCARHDTDPACKSGRRIAVSRRDVGEGTRSPQMAALKPLAIVLKCTIDELLKDDDTLHDPYESCWGCPKPRLCDRSPGIAGSPGRPKNRSDTTCGKIVRFSA